MNTLSEQVNLSYRQKWQQDGFFLIPDLISQEKCDMLKREALDVLRKHAEPAATVYVGCAIVNREFAALAEHPVIVEALTSIMDDGVEFMSDKLVYKAPGKSFPTPWHIDAWYWRNTRPKVSVWIPLDDATRANGTLTVIPGSHLRDWSRREISGVKPEFGFRAAEEEVAQLPVQVCEIKRGTAVVFSDRLLHGSTPAEGNSERYAIIGTYHAPGHEPFDEQFKARKVLVASVA